MNFKHILSGVAAIAMLGNAAPAATIEQTQNFSSDTTMSFNLFNTALGSLTGVRWRLTINTAGGSISLDNDGAGTSTGNVTFGASLGVNNWIKSGTSQPSMGIDTGFASVGATVSATSGTSATLGIDSDGGTHDFVGSDSFIYNGTSESTTSADRYVNNSFLSAYHGTGTFTADGDVNQVQNFTGSGNVFTFIAPATIGATVKLFYDYTPTEAVPEPGTIIMSILALGGVVGAKAWRKKSQPTV